MANHRVREHSKHPRPILLITCHRKDLLLPEVLASCLHHLVAATWASVDVPKGGSHEQIIDVSNVVRCGCSGGDKFFESMHQLDVAQKVSKMSSPPKKDPKIHR